MKNATPSKINKIDQIYHMRVFFLKLSAAPLTKTVTLFKRCTAAGGAFVKSSWQNISKKRLKHDATCSHFGWKRHFYVKLSCGAVKIRRGGGERNMEGGRRARGGGGERGNSGRENSG